MRRDLRVAQREVRAYRASTGHLPTAGAITNQMPHSGFGDSVYVRGHGYCLIGTNDAWRRGEDQFSFVGTGLDGMVTMDARRMVARGGACGAAMKRIVRATTLTTMHYDALLASDALHYYTENHHDSTSPVTQDMLGIEGYEKYRLDTVTLAGTLSRFCVLVTNPDAYLPQGEGAWWDSGDDTVAASRTQPQTGPCGEVTVPRQQTTREPLAFSFGMARTLTHARAATAKTGTVIANAMHADMGRNRALVGGYGRSHHGRMPTNGWGRNRIQRSGFSTASYQRSANGRGFCLTEHNNRARFGADRLLWFGNGMRHARVGTQEQITDSATTCGRILRAQQP